MAHCDAPLLMGSRVSVKSAVKGVCFVGRTVRIRQAPSTLSYSNSTIPGPSDISVAKLNCSHISVSMHQYRSGFCRILSTVYTSRE